MIKKLSFDGVAFTDVNGIMRVIYGVSLKARRELAIALTTVEQRLEDGVYKTVGELYDYDREFKAAADFALELSHIDPDWLSVPMLTEFILPHRDRDGEPQKPLLEQINFPPPPAEATESQTYAEAVAALWTHTRNFRQALDASGYDKSEFPGWTEIEEILAAHHKMTDPEGKKKAEEEAIAKQIEDSLKNGSWFGPQIKTVSETKPKQRIASPSETNQLLAELLSQK